MSIAGLLFLRVYNPVINNAAKIQSFCENQVFLLTFLNFITKGCLLYFAIY